MTESRRSALQSGRNVTLTARVTVDERSQVAAWAEAAGCDVSSYVRSAVFGETVRTKAQVQADRERGRRQGQRECQAGVARLQSQLDQATAAAQELREAIHQVIAQRAWDRRTAAATVEQLRQRADAAERRALEYESVDAFLDAVQGFLDGADSATLTVTARWARIPKRDRDRAHHGALTLVTAAVRRTAVPSPEIDGEVDALQLIRTASSRLSTAKSLLEMMGEDLDYYVPYSVIEKQFAVEKAITRTQEELAAAQAAVEEGRTRRRGDPSKFQWT